MVLKLKLQLFLKKKKKTKIAIGQPHILLNKINWKPLKNFIIQLTLSNNFNKIVQVLTLVTPNYQIIEKKKKEKESG